MQNYRAEHPDQPILYLDAGRAFPIRTQDADVVIPNMVLAYKYLGLDVLNAGDNDLTAGFDPFRAIVQAAPFKTVSATLVRTDTNQPVLPPYVVITPKAAAGSAKAPRVAVVGLTRANRDRTLEGMDDWKVKFLDPLEVASQVLPKAKAESDIVIVLANMGAGFCRLLAGAHPDIDLIIGADQEQYEVMDTDYHGTPIMMTGYQGKYAIRLDFFKQSGPRRWRVVSEITRIDDKVQPDPEAVRFVQAFQSDLDERTRLRTVTKKDPEYPDYVGSQACASCHAEAVAAWSATGHARAWQPLEKANTTMNPYCLQCHTAGFLKPNGFYIQSAQPYLANVGCEACHGPGGRHIKAPAQNQLARGDEETCRGCHTTGQSPDFRFADYWPRIKH